MAVYDKHLLDGEHLSYLIQKIKAATIANPASKSSGQVLTYNGSAWVASNPPASGVSSVTAGNNGIAIGGTSSDPTVGLQLTATQGNVALTVENDGLKANISDLSTIRTGAALGATAVQKIGDSMTGNLSFARGMGINGGNHPMLYTSNNSYEDTIVCAVPNGTEAGNSNIVFKTGYSGQLLFQKGGNSYHVYSTQNLLPLTSAAASSATSTLGGINFDGTIWKVSGDVADVKMNNTSIVDATTKIASFVTVDAVDSTAAGNQSPLSANQGKLLNDRISNLETIGRFLSIWNCATGLPLTNPSTLPYTYRTGDYYRVGAIGNTNYKPNGSSYTGAASTTVATEEVSTGDIWFYDGTNWALQSSHIGGFVEDVQVDGVSVVSEGIANIITPTIGSGVLTIKKNGTEIDTFSANATANKDINITISTNDVTGLGAAALCGVDTTITSASANLITSGAVAEAMVMLTNAEIDLIWGAA